MVYRASVNKRVVVEHPVVVGGEHLIGASHEIVVCHTAAHLICTQHERNPGGPVLGQLLRLNAVDNLPIKVISL